MPLPILHSVTGYWIAKKSGGGLSVLGACLVLANLPDLDFIPGILINEASAFHRGISHSIGFAVMAGLVAALFAGRKTIRSFAARAGLFISACASHGLLDLFNRSPKGVTLLWPFSRETLYSPLMMLGGDIDHMGPLDRAGGLADFLNALVERGVLQTAFFECFIIFLAWSLMTVLKPAHHEKRHRESIVFARAGIAAALFVISIMV